MKLAIDIDNVTANMTPHVLGALNRKYGTNYVLDDVTEWDAKFGSNGSTIEYSKELFESFAVPGFLESTPQIPGAKEGIMNLLRAGHSIFFLTSRSLKYQEQTRAWVDKNISKYLEIVHAPHGKCNCIGEFDMLLDDSPKELNEVKAWGGTPVVFDRPWNQTVTGIKRVSSWSEFEHLVETR